MDRAERDALRAAFKVAWLECAACGVVNDFPLGQKLLWHKEHNKCYILDWQFYCDSEDEGVRKDRNYLRWHLAKRGRGKSDNLRGHV
ncbi:hypothetical protein BJX96DRAFT_143670, partial [Aspergillus floccosus]